MSGLRAWLIRCIVAGVVLVLFLGGNSAEAVEDQFTVDIDDMGQVVAGQGTGFGRGAWYYYPNTDWWNQWFYSGPYDADRGYAVQVNLTVTVLDPRSATRPVVQVAMSRTTAEWVSQSDAPEPPLPRSLSSLKHEETVIGRQIVVPQTNLRDPLSITKTFEVQADSPEWISVDIRGQNIRVEGLTVHEYLDGDEFVPPIGQRDFGDAPEEALAYPSTGVVGRFPTCIGVGSAAWIEHATQAIYLGPGADIEADGNAGLCPAFNPNSYNRDEGMQDRDAGLLRPRAYTIAGAVGAEQVYPIAYTGLESLGATCFSGIWGANIDVEVHNRNGNGRDAYINLLVDWNQDGQWKGVVPCELGEVPEHALVNFPIPDGFNGSLSELSPPSFVIGPQVGYVWARLTISDRPVAEQGWIGDGVFTDGETEDYLLYVREAPRVCEWAEGDGHVMHEPQLPDVYATGTGVDMFETSLADDFSCPFDSTIKSLHFWGSFVDDVKPRAGVDGMRFQINIYANQPADNLIDWDRPGELLWTADVPRYDYDVVEVSRNVYQGWFDPKSKYYEAENHRRLYQYNICFDMLDVELFVQRRGEIYWVEIKKMPDDDKSYVFGWKTTQRVLQWNNNAVWHHPTLEWLPMTFPAGHPYEGELLDQAFVINGEALMNLDFGDAPDPAYPTLALSNGAYHTIDDVIYLGRGVDGEADGQPDASATGDDSDGSDDEDGVVFISALTCGETATVDVTASARAALNVWVDFNGDGHWGGGNEQIFVDEIISRGTTRLTFEVPAHAVPGQTFSRWRFSTTRGLTPVGAAPDGEVEDHMVTIEPGFVPDVTVGEHLIWSQPPVEWNPGIGIPVYCGWNQPAYASRPYVSASLTWKMVADDFRCLPNTPVTSVHWWGSYAAWEGLEPPQVTPDAWRIGFWSSVPGGDGFPSGKPGKLLWLVSVEADRVQEALAGVDEYPEQVSDSCFRYALTLQPHEYYWHDQLVGAGENAEVAWISVTAVYNAPGTPTYAWGWKTRPQPWSSGAVKFSTRRDDLRLGMQADSSSMAPITNSLICERLDQFDMAFELDTDPTFIKWEQPFTGIRDWPYYQDEESLATIEAASVAKWHQAPDLTTAGMGVDVTDDIPTTWPAQMAGDDFQCTTTGPITGITLWGAWYRGMVPGGDATDVTFTLSIRQNIPAQQSSTGHSMPGQVLWRKEFKPGQFSVERQATRDQSYYSPANSIYEQNTHRMIYKYSFALDAKEAFEQKGSSNNPAVYWLCAQADLVHAPGSVATRFAWVASPDHWNDAAVWAQGREPYTGLWQKLQYPKGHPSGGTPVDLAFTIETEQAGAALAYRRLVADDWQCQSNSAVTGLTWWGSYVGYGYKPCECQQMPSPQRPDYFLLSIWADAPDMTPSDPETFGHPGQKLWQYRADDFDEVLVGFDQCAGISDGDKIGYEPVYRYTVDLPEDDWFIQEGVSDIYWLSVVAVYEDPETMNYAWGWTNHRHEPWDLSDAHTVAHWKLDESSGETAADSSGNGNTGILMGSPVWRPEGGWLGGTIDLDGRGDYIIVENTAGFDFAPGSFSVSVWVNAEEVKGRWQAIMEYDRGSAKGNRFGLWIDPNGRFHFRVGLNTWHSTQSLVAGQWHLLTATYNEQTREMMIYIDGLLDAVAYNSKGFAAPVKATLTVGVRGDENGEFFMGRLDDIRVFNVTLSDDDVLTLLGVGRNRQAMAGQTTGDASAWEWTPLYDQTGAGHDVSFMIWTDPLSDPIEDPGDQDQDGKDSDGDKKNESTEGRDGEKRPEPSDDRDGQRKSAVTEPVSEQKVSDEKAADIKKQ